MKNVPPELFSSPFSSSWLWPRRNQSGHRPSSPPGPCSPMIMIMITRLGVDRVKPWSSVRMNLGLSFWGSLFKKKIMEFSISGLIPPIWPKLRKLLRNIHLNILWPQKVF